MCVYVSGCVSKWRDCDVANINFIQTTKYDEIDAISQMEGEIMHIERNDTNIYLQFMKQDSAWW